MECGYGWTMDASKRLDAATTRRVTYDDQLAERRKRTPEQSARHRQVVMGQVLQLAAQHDVDIKNLRPATDAEMDAANRAADAELAERKSEIRLRGIPSMYRDAVPDAKIPGHMLAAQWLRDYRSGKRRNLVILGSPGTGKTYLAAAVLRALLVKDYVPAVFATSKTLMDALRPSSETGDVDMQLFKFAPVLLLDDLGAERVTEFVIEQLTDLANERVQQRRPTIITSNLAPDVIKATYKDRRLIERLFSNCDVINMTGESRRVMAEGF